VRADKSFDEIGQLRSELERTSEILAKRVQGLRGKEMQIRAIIDSTPTIIFIKDLESRFLFLSRSYGKSFGLRIEEALGRTSAEIFGEKIGTALRSNDLAVIESKQPAQFEEFIVVRGKPFTYLSVKAPLFDANGEVYGICGISTDISNRLRTLAA
jgi:two-component system CheB/CheR fusion protein